MKSIYLQASGAVAQYAANQTRNHGANPFLFSISALGSFTCVTLHMVPMALCPNEASWLSSCLRTQVSRLGLKTTLC